MFSQNLIINPKLTCADANLMACQSDVLNAFRRYQNQLDINSESALSYNIMLRSGVILVPTQSNDLYPVVYFGSGKKSFTRLV